MDLYSKALLFAAGTSISLTPFLPKTETTEEQVAKIFIIFVGLFISGLAIFCEKKK